MPHKGGMREGVQTAGLKALIKAEIRRLEKRRAFELKRLVTKTASASPIVASISAPIHCKGRRVPTIQVPETLSELMNSGKTPLRSSHHAQPG
jgi:hypothetical protein